MKLTTPYLGLELVHPLIPGASPLSDTVDSVRRLEDAGAPAVVLRSLFEEQIERDQMAALESETHEQSFAEALTFFPTPQSFVFGPDEYLEHLRRVKVALSIPVIAYGLRTDFRAELFEGSRRLMEVADSIEEIKTTCRFCERKAVFNLRHNSRGEAIVEGPTVLLGADTLYSPTCYSCYRTRIDKAHKAGSEAPRADSVLVAS